MSVFYLLPPRSYLGQCFAGYLETMFPGLEWSSAAWPDLADTLTTTTRARGEVYVVYREELPDGETVERALVDGFGAETGDEIVEVRAGARPGEVCTRRWRLDRRLES